MEESPRFRLAALAAALVSLAACGSDLDILGTVPIPAGSATINADITANRTLFAETTYTITGFVKVGNGVTLTIRPGTKIQGDFNQVGSSLFILRGGKIDAQGTPASPIVFTSSRAQGSRQAGDWGGLIIIGNGIINRGNPTILEGTENFTGGGLNYAGGTDNADNSGTLKYVRVEYAGYATNTNAELNSFTFAGVGSGTTFENLQSLFGLDDSFEWFGGAVNAKYLVSYESGDDHFDASEGYTGRIQYGIAYQSIYNQNQRAGAGQPSSDPQGVENDGCNGTNCANSHRSNPMTDPMFANLTLVGTGTGAGIPTAGGIGMMLRRGTGGYYVNSIVARWPLAAFAIEDSVTNARILEGTFLLRNHLLAENTTVFRAPSGSGQSLQRYTVDLTTNNIENSTATAASHFTLLPAGQPNSESELDWSLSAGSAARTGGTGAFSGSLATKGGSFVTGTTFRGAWDPTGSKWWQGWTKYTRN